MSGWIMPDPLAMPTTRAPERSVRATCFVRRSVVKMASSKPFESGRIVCTRSGSAARIRSIGSGRPMTPVDAVSTCCGRASASAAALRPAMSSLSQVPRSPVAQFALPALTTTARTGSPLAYRARLRCTQGATRRLRVDANAQWRGTGE